MRKISSLLIAAVFMAGGAVMVQAPEVMAQSAAEQIQSGVDRVSEGNDNNDTADSAVKRIVNLFLYGIGAVAVVMIILAGFKYTTSNGDSAAVTSAKNTLLYAVVGLIVAILAYAVVNYIERAFNPWEGPPTTDTPNRGQPY